MKTTVKENRTIDLIFPCLMKHKDSKTIILATKGHDDGSILEGIIIIPDENENIGINCKTWTADEFYAFNGEVTLSND